MNGTESTTGVHCPVGLPGMDEPPRYVLLNRRFDEQHYERGERIGGYCQCPKCGLWWPVVEEPDAWEQRPLEDVWFAVEWWGGCVCEVCNLLMVSQPDGTPECYQL